MPKLNIIVRILCFINGKMYSNVSFMQTIWQEKLLSFFEKHLLLNVTIWTSTCKWTLLHLRLNFASMFEQAFEWTFLVTTDIMI